MINQTIQTQQFKSIEMINEFPISDTRKQMELFVGKISSLDVKQIKSYLGIVYFVVVSFLAITLIF